MSSTETLAWLRDWFKGRGAGGRLEDPGVNYLELGLVDSMGLMELIAAVEETFGVRFDESHFQDPRFLTLQGLAELIERLRR